MRDGRDALLVNWLEIEIVDASGKLTYRNSFVTDLPVDGRKRKAIRPLSTITSSGAPSNLGSTGCALNAHPCLATPAPAPAPHHSVGDERIKRLGSGYAITASNERTLKPKQLPRRLMHTAVTRLPQLPGSMSESQLAARARALAKSDYGAYLARVLKERA